jgi:hypothetical protein
VNSVVKDICYVPLYKWTPKKYEYGERITTFNLNHLPLPNACFFKVYTCIYSAGLFNNNLLDGGFGENSGFLKSLFKQDASAVSLPFSSFQSATVCA